jgi:hypothetical protein
MKKLSMKLVSAICLLWLAIGLPAHAFAQDAQPPSTLTKPAPSPSEPKPFKGGLFALGLRNSLNVFGDGGLIGMGAGGHFKLSASRRVNTEWFSDIIQSQGNSDLIRRDYHIGWAVQFALMKEGFASRRFVPYLMGGQCFDLTKVGFRGQYESPLVFSAAAQAGVGVSHFISRCMELNLQTQYMTHLGKHVDTFIDGNGIGHVKVEKGTDLAGHWLTTFSFSLYFQRI